MSQVEFPRSLDLPILPPNHSGEFELTSAEVLVTNEDGRHEIVTVFPGREDNRRGLTVLRRGQADPIYRRGTKMKIDGLAIDRGDGHPMVMPADRAKYVERQIGEGASKLLISVRVIEPDTGPPPWTS